MALGPSLLSTRETPAIAALVLADRVVTLLPEPVTINGASADDGAAGDSRESVRAAIDSAPSFLRLMESWRWSGPLWKAGVLGRGCGGVASQNALSTLYARIENERELAALRRWTRHVLELQREGRDASAHAANPFKHDTDTDECLTDTHDSSGHSAPVLQALCADILKGGPDPGFNIPLAAAMDAFALQHGLLSVRASIDTLTQRAESRLSRRVFTLGLPMLTRGSGRAILQLREALKAELAALRASISDAIAAERSATISTTQTPRAASPALTNSNADSTLKSAAEAYSRAFEAWSRVHVPGDDDRGERLTVGYCSLSLIALPPDAVLLSAIAAMGSLSPRASTSASPARSSAATSSPRVSRETSTGSSAQASPGVLYALVVKELNVRPEPMDAARTTDAAANRAVGAKG